MAADIDYIKSEIQRLFKLLYGEKTAEQLTEEECKIGVVLIAAELDEDLSKMKDSIIHVGGNADSCFHLLAKMFVDNPNAYARLQFWLNYEMSKNSPANQNPPSNTIN